MNPIRILQFAACAVVLASPLLAAPVQAQDPAGHEGHPAASPTVMGATLPTEVGQATFAAVAEIVRLLEADPTTDWSKVNLDALREHLRDMDRVMLHAEVQADAIEGGVMLVVTGEGEVRDAIRRMLFAHAGALEGEMAVAATPSHHDDGLVLTVVARDPSDAALVTRIRGLGFAGLLAVGAHHQPHHLAIATGAIAAGAHEHH